MFYIARRANTPTRRVTTRKKAEGEEDREGRGGGMEEACLGTRGLVDEREYTDKLKNSLILSFLRAPFHYDFLYYFWGLFKIALQLMF